MKTSYKTLVCYLLCLVITALIGCSKSEIVNVKAKDLKPTLRISDANAINAADAALNAYEDIQTLVLVSTSNARFDQFTGTAITPLLRPTLISRTVDCPIRGTRTQTFTARTPSTQGNWILAAGDIVGQDFDSCDMGNEFTLSGSLTVTVLASEGNPISKPFSYSYELNYTNLSLSLPGRKTALHGTVVLEDSESQGGRFTRIISGDKVQYTTGNGKAGTLRDFRMINVRNLNSEVYEQLTYGLHERVDLGGSIRYQTVDNLEGFVGAPPYSGMILVSGDASSATVNIIDSANMSIEIDDDHNGVFDQTLNTSWDELSDWLLVSL